MAGGALACLLLVGCGSDRPAPEDWRAGWEAVTSAIPDEETVSETLAVAVCEQTLAHLRANRTDLLPSPDMAIDDAVNSWFEIAEDAFFECPPANEEISSFAEAYAELMIFEAEIELVLELRESS